MEKDINKQALPESRANAWQPSQEGHAPAMPARPFSVSASPTLLQRVPAAKEIGEAVDDAAVYYVTDPDASVRQNDDPAKIVKGKKIPKGTRVKRLRQATAGTTSVAQIEVLDPEGNSGVTTGEKLWTKFPANVSSLQTLSDTAQYFVSFSDTLVYQSPAGKIKTETQGDKTVDKKLAASQDTGYTLRERCGSFVKIRQGESDIGWIYEAQLIDATANTRVKYLDKYKTWLNDRFTEISALQAAEKTTRAAGILSQVEEVAQQLEAGKYPEIDKLSKTPTAETHSYRSFVPPELSAKVREFIVLIESQAPAETTATPAGSTEATAPATTAPASGTTSAVATTTTSSETSPSTQTTTPAPAAAETVNWNARLGIPQYRTQSDNLTPPEVTCGPTSFSMATERLGYSREDVRAAIDEQLTEHRKTEYRKSKWRETEYRKQLYLETEAGKAALAAKTKVTVPTTFQPNPQVPADFTPVDTMPATFLTSASAPGDFVPDTPVDDAVLQAKWKEKAKEFFKSFTGDDYQKLRGGSSSGLLGKEKQVAEKFRDYGQYEDFMYFLAYLNAIARGEMTGAENSKKLLGKLNSPTTAASYSSVERIDLATEGKEFGAEHRVKIRNTLQQGGSVILSFRHKGMQEGTHIVTVRNVAADGLELDDPYGKINPDYRRKVGLIADAYTKVGVNTGRSNYDWKNVPEYNKTETDHTKQDFTEEKSEDLKANESRGADSKISWAMISESTLLISYIEMIQR